MCTWHCMRHQNQHPLVGVNLMLTVFWYLAGFTMSKSHSVLRKQRRAPDGDARTGASHQAAHLDIKVVRRMKTDGVHKASLVCKKQLNNSRDSEKSSVFCDQVEHK